MTVRANKPAFNIREKLKSLDYSHLPYEKMPLGSVLQVSVFMIPNNVVFNNTTYTTAYTHTIKPKSDTSKLIHHFWSKSVMNNTSENTGQDYRVRGGLSTSSDDDKTTIIRATWQNYWNRADFSSDYYPPCDFIMSHEPQTTESYSYIFQGSKYGNSAGNWTIGQTNMSGGPSPNRGSWVIYEVAQ